MEDVINDLPRMLTTEQAAKALNRRPQTLRTWACFNRGPVKPINICGRLAWPRDQIMAVLTGTQAQG